MNESSSSKTNSKTPKVSGKKSEEKIRDDQDKYCWICHKDKYNISCQICSRSYHTKCINNNITYSHLDSLNVSGSKKSILNNNWICVECELIIKSESAEGRSNSLKMLTKEEFSDLLKYSLATIKKLCDITFHTPVNLQIFKDYTNFIVHPMDFYKIEQYISTNKYCSTEAFISDCKWILHNCYIYNQAQNPLTVNARYMLKIAKNEMYEIETCPDCFKNYYVYGSKDFFVQTCRYPHNLVFAKLKGHPLWPSKVVKLNQESNEVEVRFFGAHDKAFINYENCFLLHEKSFNMSKVAKNQKSKLEAALKELKTHIEILNKNHPGLFKYSPPKTSFKPELLYLLPNPYLEIVQTENNLTITNDKISEDNNLTNLSKDDLDDSKISQSEDLESETISKKKLNNQNTKKTNLDSNKVDIKNNKSFDETLNFEDSDENDDKLIIDDSIVKKRRSLVRKLPIEENTNLLKIKNIQSSNKRKIQTILPSNSANKTTEENNDSLISVLPKKKMKKNLTNFSNITPDTKSTVNNRDKNSMIENLLQENQNLKDELERNRTLHIAEIREMYINHKAELKELQANFQLDKEKALKELCNELEVKYDKELDETKRKKWCNFCPKEANYFCCHISSYCSYSCQSKDWPQHMARCLQGKINETNTISSTITNSDVKLKKEDESVPDQSFNVVANTSFKDLSKSSKNITDSINNDVDTNVNANVNSNKNKHNSLTDNNETNEFLKQVKSENEHFPEKPKDRFIKKLNENNLKAHKAEIEKKNQNIVLEGNLLLNNLKPSLSEVSIEEEDNEFKDNCSNFSCKLTENYKEKISIDENQNLEIKSESSSQSKTCSNEIQENDSDKLIIKNEKNLFSKVDEDSKLCLMNDKKINDDGIQFSSDSSLNKNEENDGIFGEVNQIKNELLDKVENQLKIENSKN